MFQDGSHGLRWHYLDAETALFYFDDSLQGGASLHEGPISSTGDRYDWNTDNWLPYHRGHAPTLEAAQEAVERVWAKRYPGFAKDVRFDWSE